MLFCHDRCVQWGQLSLVYLDTSIQISRYCLIGSNQTEVFKAVTTYWGRVTHICVSNKAIIWTNAGILLIGPLGTNFSEISIEIHILSSKKMHLKMSSGKWRSFCVTRPPHNRPFVMGNHWDWVLVDSTHRRLVIRGFDFFFVVNMDSILK